MSVIDRVDNMEKVSRLLDLQSAFGMFSIYTPIMRGDS